MNNSWWLILKSYDKKPDPRACYKWKVKNIRLGRSFICGLMGKNIPVMCYTARQFTVKPIILLQQLHIYTAQYIPHS